MKTTKNCPACSREVSITAKTCPQCGHDLEARAKVIAAVVLGALCLGCFWLCCGGGASLFTTPPTEEERAAAEAREEKRAAWYLCTRLVEGELAAPSTAEWPLWDDAEVSLTRTGPDAWRVRGYVDAENRFGAQVRQRFTCAFHRDRPDHWSVDSLTFD